jgi:hypothetical protein
VPSTPALAHAPPTHKAHRAPTTPQLSSRFNSRATHARTLLHATHVRVRVRVMLLVPCGARRFLSTRTHTPTHTPDFYDPYEYKSLAGFILINKQPPQGGLDPSQTNFGYCCSGPFNQRQPRCCQALSFSHKAQRLTS